MSDIDVKKQQDAIDAATDKVIGIREEGILYRNAITKAQVDAIAYIDKQLEEKTSEDISCNVYREELIQQIGNAARDGDLKLMEQLKAELLMRPNT